MIVLRSDICGRCAPESMMVRLMVASAFPLPMFPATGAACHVCLGRQSTDLALSCLRAQVALGWAAGGSTRRTAASGGSLAVMMAITPLPNPPPHPPSPFGRGGRELPPHPRRGRVGVAVMDMSTFIGTDPLVHSAPPGRRAARLPLATPIFWSQEERMRSLRILGPALALTVLACAAPPGPAGQRAAQPAAPRETRRIVAAILGEPPGMSATRTKPSLGSVPGLDVVEEMVNDGPALWRFPAAPSRGP